MMKKQWILELFCWFAAWKKYLSIYGLFI